MNACRICRTKSNLKYAPEQLATKRKKLNANETQEIVGNICLECEQRLLNYHKLDEHKDLEVDSGREETPVIVDDDDLLYNLFFENSNNADIENEKNASSSDCDTAVIELASSREITPQQQNIVAVIDLSDASQSGTETTTATQTTTTTTVNKKRKRHKTYDEKQLIVLAKLNLISSDSEEDEIYPPARARTNTEQQQQQTDMPVEQSHNEVQCCVCKSVFNDNLELVHHLRSRHRTKEHVTQLRERMRHAQDSALTIRLCFKARFFYYECQMCGHIDDVFRQHKEHVIAKHSHELISLKDPLLKRLQCPVCHVSSGTKYIEVCRHMLQTHSSMQYKFFIEEIISSTDEALKSVATTAQVYRFHTRPNLYFLCRHCQHLNRSINSHRQHLKFKHQIKITHNLLEVQVNNTTANLQQRSLREKKKKQEEQEQPELKLEQSLEKRKVGRPRKNFVVNAPVKVKKLVKTSVKKGVSNRRSEPHTATQRVRIKVKPPIKQIVTQTYNCQYCKRDFAGFLLWNLHHLKEHSEKVDCVFNTNKERLTRYKHKREKRHKTLSLTVDENSNNVEKKQGKMCRIENEEKTEDDDITPYVPNWLQELQEMHQSKQTLKNVDNEHLHTFSSGFMKMRPNTAILKQTPNLRCIRLYNRN